MAAARWSWKPVRHCRARRTAPMPDADFDRFDLRRRTSGIEESAALPANTGGGVIMIGLRTRREGSSEAIDEVRPVTATLIDRDRYRKLVRERVFPFVRGFATWWLPAGDERGLLVIDVPAQASKDKPSPRRQLPPPPRLPRPSRSHRIDANPTAPLDTEEPFRGGRRAVRAGWAPRAAARSNPARRSSPPASRAIPRPR
jgi:hypothetical protein